MRPASPLLVSAALMVAAADATAMGFGRVLSRTTLGEPLNMAVALRLDPGETIEDGCVAAVVMAGDNRVPAEDVRVRITGGGDERILRVSTRTAIDEPVVNVTLSVGCPPRLTREFVTLADPPSFTPALAAPAAPVPAPSSAQAAPAAVAPPRVGEGPSAAPRPPRSTPAPAVAARPPPPRRVATAPTPPRARPAAPAPAPRLRLDMTEPVRSAAASIPAVAAPPAPVVAAPPAPVASAVAALPVAAAASADDARVRALEEELARMRAEAKAQRDALTALQSRLAQADRPAAADAAARWLPWLLGLLLALLAGLLLLALRVRRLAREQALVQVASRGDSSLLPGANGESRPAPWEAARLPDEVEVTEHESTQAPSVMQPDTMPHETPHPAPASLRHEVSIEEQIDLEQQADFFSALGQDDQAVDLLVTHLRGTGGANPMPYLKLMDIHRRRGEREAYERTRERFNLRFNAVAPDWNADPRGGRTLEDYPQVLARLEQAWWQPLDAMTELETLLFQRGPTADRFDMAAYQELVMLYRMAREQRLDEEKGGSSQVDVLLPLEGAGSAPPAVQVRHVDIGPTTVTPPTAIDIELPGPFELDLPRDDDAKPRQ
jgi:pilus assembly protein FimV